ncbi:MAG: aldo/keto reductase [Exilibacterium sp.]
MKLALGTVQFGMDYGVTNRAGQVGMAEVEKILRLAADAGIDTLDTAVGYGDAEARVGRVLAGGGVGSFGAPPFKVVTKLPGGIKAADVAGVVEGSLRRVGVEGLDGLLAHSAGDLLSASGQGVIAAMEGLKREGLCERVGASLYYPCEFAGLAEEAALDLFQVPLSLLDQRFNGPEVVSVAGEKGLSLHGRSLLLQGVLVEPLGRLPGFFQGFSNYLRPLGETAARFGVDLLTLALTAAWLSPAVERVVLGCCSEAQLRQLIECFDAAAEVAGEVDLAAFACDDEKLLLPVNWVKDV